MKKIAVATITGRSTELPPKSVARMLSMADGTLEALKWLALMLMVLDHVNKFLYAEKLPVLFELGRLVMPIFGFVLAYNLARPGALEKGVHIRMMKRLALFGVLSSPMFIVLVGWWPLNILFVLLLTAIVCLLERRGKSRVAAAMALFVVAGAFVEFWWFAFACCLAAWAYCREPSVKRLVIWGLVVVSQDIVSDQSEPLGVGSIADHSDCCTPGIEGAPLTVDVLRGLPDASAGARGGEAAFALSVTTCRGASGPLFSGNHPPLSSIDVGSRACFAISRYGPTRGTCPTTNRRMWSACRSPSPCRTGPSRRRPRTVAAGPHGAVP